MSWRGAGVGAASFDAFAGALLARVAGDQMINAATIPIARAAKPCRFFEPPY